MSTKNLKKIYRSEKRAARAEYKERMRRARNANELRLDEYYLKTGEARPKNPPKRSVLEEVGNSVTHGLGGIFGIVSLILMLVFAEGAAEVASAIIYSVGITVMFTVSCIYHALPHGRSAKRIFRRFDYTCIYILIGATFAPSLLAYFGNTFGIVFFIIQWAVIALGITLVGVFGPDKLRFIHIPLYVVLGWSALMLLPGMINGAFSMAMFILAGGIIYTLGIIPYAIKLRGSHFIWHFFVLAGAVVQWIGIFTTLYLG